MLAIKRNAIIMAAGTSSRFVPLSAEKPKGLLEVNGEILIERQIRQLQEAGINDITVVVGYKSEMFVYLKDKFNVRLVLNEDYKKYNNTSSLIRVLDRLSNTYICSSDNYFPNNVFLEHPEESYYSALYTDGDTNEYCLTINTKDEIEGVSVGGHDSWYMVGHVYFAKIFSEKFKGILTREYENEETRLGYWEDVYIKHIHELPPMLVHRYCENEIEEFDSLDELRMFDKSYLADTRSTVIKDIALQLHCKEDELKGFYSIPHEGDYLLFSFLRNDESYQYNGHSKQVSSI